mmetsp:Transcript_20720/g.73158  ORF Transcript_20720/g.73158 Transcript_20720/m.73158 type:complete len:328 (-) Transcript_20720:390-1373(-)
MHTAKLDERVGDVLATCLHQRADDRGRAVLLAAVVLGVEQRGTVEVRRVRLDPVDHPQRRVDSALGHSRRGGVRGCGGGRVVVAVAVVAVAGAGAAVSPTAFWDRERAGIDAVDENRCRRALHTHRKVAPRAVHGRLAAHDVNEPSDRAVDGDSGTPRGPRVGAAPAHLQQRGGRALVIHNAGRAQGGRASLQPLLRVASNVRWGMADEPVSVIAAPRHGRLQQRPLRAALAAITENERVCKRSTHRKIGMTTGCGAVGAFKAEKQSLQQRGRERRPGVRDVDDHRHHAQPAARVQAPCGVDIPTNPHQKHAVHLQVGGVGVSALQR